MELAVAQLPDLIELARAAERQGELDLALRTYEEAFALIPKVGDGAHAAPVLRWIGTIHRRRGQLDLAEEVYRASELIALATSDDANLAGALNCLGILAQLRAQMDEAATLYEEARRFADAGGDERLAAMIDQNLGTLANIRGDVGSAISRYRSAYDRFTRLEDEAAMVWALNNLGMAHTDLGEWQKAAECFDNAFDIANQLRDAELLGTIELNRAELFLKSRDFAGARESCDRSFEIFSRIQSPGSLGEAFKFYGVLYREMRRPALGVVHFDKAAQMAAQAEDRLLEAETQAEWAVLELDSGDNAAALRRLNRAHGLFTNLRATTELMDLDARLDRLEQNYLRVMQRWAESIESKDLYTAGHCERVANYACMLAEAVGISGRDLTWFRMGAYLHDVGKTAIDGSVLNKPGKLDEKDWEHMKQHTVVGHQIVADLNFPWDIAPMVRNHHERWDGTGYPDRIAGEAIPLTARILCVADVFDALTTTRSYRPALSRADALRIMARDSGKQFDAELFTLFCKLLDDAPMH